MANELGNQSQRIKTSLNEAPRIIDTRAISIYHFMAETTRATSQSLSSEKTTVASHKPLPPSAPENPIHPSNTSDASKFLKPSSSPRKRRRSPDISRATLTETDLTKSPSPVSPKIVTPLAFGSARLTAAAEMEQKRRKIEVEKQNLPGTSPNPQLKALGALLGTDKDSMSRPEDAPTTTDPHTMSEAVAAIAPIISIPPQASGEGSVQTSPVSLTSSIGTAESTSITAISTNGLHVASPGQMGEDDRGPSGPRHEKQTGQQTEDGSSNKAFSYPGPLINAALNDARRGMSLPGSGVQRENSRSPSSSSNKRHKCPYCSTEFTRHHNLKSHLLTHSHEKPYLCQTCDSRFRRLHDLKRHTKLHTGERPHICPKCKRSFARGDALARHNKGQGGCAGRRSSVGSFGGDGNQDGEDSMQGMVYTNEASHEPDNMDDDAEGAEERAGTLPSIRRHDAPSDQPYRSDTQSTYQRQPSTYPPVATRPMVGGSLYPPVTPHGGTSGSTSPNSQISPLPSFPPPPQTSRVIRPLALQISPNLQNLSRLGSIQCRQVILVTDLRHYLPSSQPTHSGVAATLVPVPRRFRLHSPTQTLRIFPACPVFQARIHASEYIIIQLARTLGRLEALYPRFSVLALPVSAVVAATQQVSCQAVPAIVSAATVLQHTVVATEMLCPTLLKKDYGLCFEI